MRGPPANRFSTTPTCTSVMSPMLVDHASQQNHCQVRGVLPDPVVAQRNEFVAGGRQPHHAAPVHHAGTVDVPARKLERELGPQRLALRNRRVAEAIRALGDGDGAG